MDRSLSNDRVSVAFDERGNLLSLFNRKTGCEYITKPGLGLWLIFYAGERDPETPVRGREQSPAEFRRESGALVIRHPTLIDHEGQRIEAALTYRAVLQTDELILMAEIENRSAPEIRELWFPLVGGLGGLGGDPESSFLLYPESAGRRIRNPVKNLADRNAQPVRGLRFNFLRDFYPGRASMQWMGLYGTGGSLYVGSHDATRQTTALNALLNVGHAVADDSLSLGFIKYPFVPAGGRWTSQPFVVAVHDRSWHHDARRYRAFTDTWQDHRRAKPAWLQDAPAMHDIVMLHQHGRVNYRYDQIPDIAEAGRSGGVDVLKLTGWSHGGHDNMYPDFVPSERLGGEQVMVDNFRRAQSDGYRLCLYFHFAQMSPNSEFYKRQGEFCAMKGPGGNPFIDIFTWPSHGSILQLNERRQLINACPGAGPWQEQVLDCVRRGLEWGVDAIFLDQTAGGPGSFLCFDKRHGHPTPAQASGPGKCRLSAEARRLVKARSEQTALGAEYMADCILEFYDFTIPFGMGFFHGDQHFGEMYRFTFPEDIVFTQYISREDLDQLHYSFVMGYRFFLAPRQQCHLLSTLEPAFLDRLSALVRLRRKHGAVLLRGRYLATEPLVVGNPALVAQAFECGNESVVAVWNPAPEPQGIGISWPGRRLREVETPAGLIEGDARISPGDVAVLVYDRA